eukprot:gene612-510_t
MVRLNRNTRTALALLPIVSGMKLQADGADDHPIEVVVENTYDTDLKRAVEVALAALWKSRKETSGHCPFAQLPQGYQRDGCCRKSRSVAPTGNGHLADSVLGVLRRKDLRREILKFGEANIDENNPEERVDCRSQEILAERAQAAEQARQARVQAAEEARRQRQEFFTKNAFPHFYGTLFVTLLFYFTFDSIVAGERPAATSCGMLALGLSLIRQSCAPSAGLRQPHIPSLFVDSVVAALAFLLPTIFIALGIIPAELSAIALPFWAFGSFHSGPDEARKNANVFSSVSRDAAMHLGLVQHAIVSAFVKGLEVGEQFPSEDGGPPQFDAMMWIALLLSKIFDVRDCLHRNSRARTEEQNNELEVGSVYYPPLKISVVTDLFLAAIGVIVLFTPWFPGFATPGSGEARHIQQPRLHVSSFNYGVLWGLFFYGCVVKDISCPGRAQGLIQKP